MIAKKLKAFGAFWFDFIIGDDWRVSVGVVVALTATYALAHNGHPGAWWLVVLASAVLLPTSIWRATRKSR